MEEKNTCALAGICGGCAFCGETYEAQLQIKNETVKNLLEGAAREEFEYEGIAKSPLIFAYRNKMEYSFGDERKNGPLTLGLHKKRSFYDVIDADCCQIVHEDFNEIVRETRAYFDELGATYKDKRSHRGFLRHLLVRRAVNTGEILVDLVTTSQPLIPVMAHNLINDDVLYDEEALKRGELVPSSAVNVYDNGQVVEEWAKRLLRCKEEGRIQGCFRGILHTVNDSKADAVKNEGTRILYGEDSICEEILGLKFRITPFSFFQTNSRGAEVLYEKAREYVAGSLTENSTVYDLYSGTGTIAQILAADHPERVRCCRSARSPRQQCGTGDRVPDRGRSHRLSHRPERGSSRSHRLLHHHSGQRPGDAHRSRHQLPAQEQHSRGVQRDRVGRSAQHPRLGVCFLV